jgi:hypothetical protein
VWSISLVRNTTGLPVVTVPVTRINDQRNGELIHLACVLRVTRMHAGLWSCLSCDVNRCLRCDVNRIVSVAPSAHPPIILFCTATAQLTASLLPVLLLFCVQATTL